MNLYVLVVFMAPNPIDSKGFDGRVFGRHRYRRLGNESGPDINSKAKSLATCDFGCRPQQHNSLVGQLQEERMVDLAHDKSQVVASSHRVASAITKDIERATKAVCDSVLQHGQKLGG